MSVELCDSVTAEVVYGIHLQSKPRWGLRELSLITGPYYSGDEHEQHFLRTIGSGSWYRSEFDELRFGKEDMILQSIWFHVPEKSLSSDELINEWRDLEPIDGLLRLKSSQSFQLDPTEFRLMEPDGTLFMCVTQRAISEKDNRLRLRLADDLDLLFANQCLCGWLLSNPSQYLVSSWEAPCINKPDSKFAALLYEYLTLVVEPNVDRMEKGDTNILCALADLQMRIGQVQGSKDHRIVLHESIDGIIKQFYSRKV